MRLLLVEDKDSFRRLLVQALEGSAWEVTALADPASALDILAVQEFELLVTDLRLPGFSGIELLKRAKRLRPALRILLMSAFGEPKDIVEALQHGADDFLPKPFDLDRFTETLDRLGSLALAPPPDPREPWAAVSAPLRALETGLLKAAEASVPVLFTGPTGSGRGRAARRLHQLRCPRAPFLQLQAETLSPERLREAQHTARGGSLHLGDLEHLPPGTLPLLLHGLEGGQVHWTASAPTLEALPESLRLRIGVLHFDLPPLAARREDILPTFRLILEAAAKRAGRNVPALDRLHERDLVSRVWPGNLRELAWTAEETLRLNPEARVLCLPSVSPTGRHLSLPWPESSTLEAMLGQVSKAAEAELLRQALRLEGADLARCAQRLGLSARALALRLREHQIPLDDEREGS